MSQIMNVRFGGGYVSTGTGGRDASDLDDGELQSMSGAYYRKDDPHQAWKMPGRSLFGATEAGRVNGVAVCQFDGDGADKILAAVGTKIYGATPGSSGAFASLATGLSASATTFVAAHQDDRWYLCNGLDENRVLMPDGTVRLMGMKAPTGQPLAAPSVGIGSTVFRPTSTSTSANDVSFVGPFVSLLPSYGGGFFNPNSGMDSDETTFASGVVPTSGNPSQVQYQVVQRWTGFSDSSLVGRSLKVLFGGNIHNNSTAHIGVDYSVADTGGGFPIWIPMLRIDGTDQPITKRWVETPLPENNALVKVRAYATSPYQGTSIQIYDIRIEAGSDAVSTTTTGIYYFTTEYYGAEDLESPPSQPSNIVQLSQQGQVIVTRPAVVNPAATHWYVYRVPDGLDPLPENAGRVSGQIDISQTTWTDPFDPFGIDDLGSPVIAMMTVAGQLPFPRDVPPVPFVSMISWKGSICGISLGFPRSWFYSEAGRPESFPEVYVVTSFPLDENDSLVGQMAVGESLVFLLKGACLAIDDVPRITDGVYNPTDARPLKGHPGCVGIYAYTTWSVAGEPRGAWVSPHGVYVTNGTICACISTDLAWTREVNVPFLETAVLKWDANNLILWFQFDLDGDGNNDREIPFHMAESHSKDDNRHKIGQPTEKATSCMAFALVDSAYLRYSGHPSNGEVYLEDSGTVDAATGGEVEMVVRSGQISNQRVNLGVIKATVAHSDFGSGETGTIIATVYRDSANSENSRSQSVRLDGNRGTTVGIGRAGELVDVEVSYSGPGIGGLGGVQLEIDGQGRSGSAPRVSSNSVTQ